MNHPKKERKVSDLIERKETNHIKYVRKLLEQYLFV